PLVLVVVLALAAIFFWVLNNGVGLSPRTSVWLTGGLLVAAAIVIQRKRRAPVWPEQTPGLSGTYAMTMLVGIGLFYAAILFMAVALVVLSGGLVFLMLSSPNLSLWLIGFLGLAGVLAWLFFSMVLAEPAKGKRGIVVNSADIARLRQAIDEATRK